MKKYIFLFLLLTIYQGIYAKSNDKDRSILASGKWIKISASDEGICMLTYKQLSDWGISSPENLAVYTNGGYMLPKMNNISYPDDLMKVPVIHRKNSNGENSVFFYSTGSVKWEYDKATNKYIHDINLYTSKTFFYLSSDLVKSSAPIDKASNNDVADVTLNKYEQHLLYEQENINLLNTGRRWYSDEISKSQTKTFTFKSSDVNSTDDAILTISVGNGAGYASRYKVEVNNVLAGYQSFRTPGIDKAVLINSDFIVKSSSEAKVTLTYEVDGSNGNSWINYITLTQKGTLKKGNQPLIFRNSEVLNHANVKYNISSELKAPVLWDISDPLQPLALKYTINSNSLSFTDVGLKLTDYVLFDTEKDNFIDPGFESNVDNQNIHGLPLYDFIIVTHPKFLSASETLADYHRQHDAMKVLVVTTDEVYNEFSSGMPDVSAIRNMARMFYQRRTTSDSLRYILLMGDGSYNNRSTDENIPNYIPTYQSMDSEGDGSFVSDDYFVLLDDDEGESIGTLDIGIGRIPCRTIEEANLVVSKTMEYTASETMGDWRNVITFLADDEDNNQHMEYTEKLIDLLKQKNSDFYTNKIYFDSYTQIKASGGDRYPEVTKAIKQRVEDGTLILNYMGHANERGLAHENVLGISDINSWSNSKKLPVFVTATCEFSRFDNTETSAGEQILFNPAGGGVALFSTTRVVYSYDNYKLNDNFYKSIYMTDDDGNYFRMGDIMRMAKNLTTGGDNKRNFTLLGDPALRLAFPKYQVITEKINDRELNDSITLGALDKVTVESKVFDRSGNFLSNFTGKVNTTVYDKAVDVQTLANDGGLPFEYSSQTNLIYKGTSTVTDGKFTFSFIIPKDISYNIGQGKIFYYVSNGEEDGNGSSEMFNIGGSSANPIIDNDPPEVKMYLNNEKFRFNDKVSSSALLLVNLFDESGINTVGTGIGHDIVALLDNDYSSPMVLNEYYQSELDSYQHGKILFPLNNLKPGEHSISIKVWDIQNNSTLKELSFIVEEGFEITSVTNYPNPVSFHTTFDITHNLPGDVFNTTLEIFNLSGYKIWEINETSGSYGSVNASIRWDVTNTNYPIDREKILVYRVTMVNQQGLRATGAGKLLLKLN